MMCFNLPVFSTTEASWVFLEKARIREDISEKSGATFWRVETVGGWSGPVGLFGLVFWGGRSLHHCFLFI